MRVALTAVATGSNRDECFGCPMVGYGTIQSGGAHRKEGLLVSLTQTRCFNHGQREAVARCPSCKRHFCRECVTEHDHKLLCASCIQALAAAGPAPRDRHIPFRPLIQLACAVFVLWMTFYVMGQALLLIPSEFHDTYDTTLDDMRSIESEPGTPEPKDEGAANPAETSP